MTTALDRLTLRRILILDGGACIGMGLGLALLAPALGPATDLAVPFLRGAGLLLLPVGLFILAIAARSEIPAWGVTILVAGNAAWVAVSVALPLLGLLKPNGLGLLLLLGQAAAVAILAGLEHMQRPRPTRPLAA